VSAATKKLAQKLVSRRKLENDEVKLHIGSGDLIIDDTWINIDLTNLKNVDLALNVTEGLPFKSDSVDYVFSEHFIEHLPKNGGKAFLKEVFRILKPGGAHRILTPDIRGCVDVFLSEKWRDIAWTQNHNLSTSAEYLNATMRLWGHQFIYDKETLAKYADQAGYLDVSWEEFGKSRFSVFEGIDTRINSIILDCVKG